jgi:hypothetical protein
MDIAIGLPSTVPDTDGNTLVEWARTAEGAGFSSLGVLDRLMYPGYDPIVSLAAAAAVTERIGLLTAVLLRSGASGTARSPATRGRSAPSRYAEAGRDSSSAAWPTRPWSAPRASATDG